MPKYINADELINQLDEFRSNADNDYADGKNGMIDVTRVLIAEMPTADVVEVVRCKDCKYFIKFAEDYISVEDADGMCDFYDCGMKRLDFCSYGERREADNG